MALSNEDKQNMLDALQSAYYEGVLVIKYNDKEVRYRSKSEMRELIDELKKELGTANKTSKCFAKFSKGLC